MRARHRHLNPGSAGAVLALDSRFISGLNDGDAVATWEDRTNSNNDATQSTSGNRPSYQTAEQGGCPAVYFDNDFMTGALSSSNLNMAVIAVWRESNQADIYDGLIAAYNGTGNDFDNVNAWLLSAKDSDVLVARFAWGLNSSFVRASSTTTEPWEVLTVARASNVASIDVNGVQIASTSSLTTSSGTTNQYVLGARFISGSVDAAYALEGWVGMMTFIPADNRALLRRLEHAAAFSFKIACS